MSDLATQLASSPLTIGGIKCASISIEPRPGRERSSGTWKLLCMWSDAPALHAAMLGGPVTTTPAGGGTPTTTYNPTQVMPGWPGMIYTGANLEGIPGADGIVIDATTGKINYKYATFAANFETQQWGFDGDNQKGLPSMRAGTEIFTPENGSTQWSDGTVINVAAPIALPLLNVSIPIYNQPLVNFSVLTNALQNPLNSVAMPIFGNVGPKKVRYDGSETQWLIVSNTPRVNMTHHFSIRSMEWDKELRKPATGSGSAVWDTVKLKGGGDLIGQSDLNQILS